MCNEVTKLIFYISKYICFFYSNLVYSFFIIYVQYSLKPFYIKYNKLSVYRNLLVVINCIFPIQ